MKTVKKVGKEEQCKNVEIWNCRERVGTSIQPAPFPAYFEIFALHWLSCEHVMGHVFVMFNVSTLTLDFCF